MLRPFLFFLLCLCVGARPLSPTNDTVPRLKRDDDFRSDKDVTRYLASRNTDVILHRCQNAVEVTYKTLPTMIELQCEILGRVKSLEFHHNFRLLPTGSGKYSLTAYPHVRDGRYFSRWLDYTLRISEASSADAGMYSVRVTGASGLSEEQYVFVNLKQAAKPEVRMGKRNRKRKKKKRARDKDKRRRKDRRKGKKKDRRRKGKKKRNEEGKKKRKDRRRKIRHHRWQTMLYQT